MSRNDDLFPWLAEGVVTVYDYIDGDGDMLSLDLVDDHWLAVTVIAAGKKAALTSILSEASDARKMAGHLLAYAEMKEAM